MGALPCKGIICNWKKEKKAKEKCRGKEKAFKIICQFTVTLSRPCADNIMKLLATVRPLSAEYFTPVYLLYPFVLFFFPLSGSVGNLVLIFTHCECFCCSFLEMTSLLDNIDSSSVKSAGIKGQKEQCFFPPSHLYGPSSILR